MTAMAIKHHTIKIIAPSFFDAGRFSLKRLILPNKTYEHIVMKMMTIRYIGRVVMLPRAQTDTFPAQATCGNCSVVALYASVGNSNELKNQMARVVPKQNVRIHIFFEGDWHVIRSRNDGRVII